MIVITVKISIIHDDGENQNINSVESSGSTIEELEYLTKLVQKLKTRPSAYLVQEIDINSLPLKRVIMYKEALSSYPGYKGIKEGLKNNHYNPITMVDDDVADGVFRVLIAKELGMKTIKAHVL